ncbi:MAG: acetate--CoA ligase [Bdellovibrio sp.]|nr:acetate--CoA ligase [Bdellovibrio sp.]
MDNIFKKNEQQKRKANLNESQLASDFSWQKESEILLAGNSGFVNIADLAVGAHSRQGNENKVALRFIGKSWPQDKNDFKEITYLELLRQVRRFAHSLKRIGHKKGDVLFSLGPRLPQTYITALGTMGAGLVFAPLFSVFGPEPILARMSKGNGKVLFTLASLYHKKIAPIRGQLISLESLIILDDDGSAKNIPNYYDFEKLLADSDEAVLLEKTHSEDLALLHFTSGTTGRPKGAMHVHGAVIYHKLSRKWAFDFKQDDVFWCTADPGWVTGTSYGIISPLCNGVTLLIDEADFNATRWYEILQTFKVSVWYTAPTGMRMLMKAGEDLPSKYDFSSVRYAASVGEALNPEVVLWAKKNLNIILHDNWWQTETGGIIISNYAGMDVKPGSMGKPIPGIEVALINVKQNKIEEVKDSEIAGEIAVKKGWPSMFRGYLGDDERYAKCFIDDWYLSGDLARKDKDGYYWFVGRNDDVIKSAGHLIGPVEIENALMEHAHVLESAVIGLPEPIIGEKVKAFVVLKKNIPATEELKLEIMAFARQRLGVAIAPREISFLDTLPKTKSGKIMRRLLKARELGLDEGDLSTMETT